MPKTKLELSIALALLAAIGGLCWWLFFGPTPKQKFLREVERTVQTVNEGNHGKVKERFSPEFIQFVRGHGFDPQQIILLIHQTDSNQNAQYRIDGITRFEPNDFAEVKFIRKSTDGEQSFTLPFVYRNRKWWITDTFRSDAQWVEFPSI